ncbi:MAG: Ig-like domain-containing protein, partial [Phycisphaerae bacterium]|nr:Ig-like domain-containing protein [Phycisphaerae bacterium]
MADLIIAQRRADGSTDYTEYFPSTAPGLWQPTAPMFAPALLPNWATLTPFSMTSPDQFLPQGPMALTSAQYTAEYNEVRSIGAANSTTRTADQTAIARFWADGAGTYTPAGHWNQIATSIAQSQNLSLFDTARLMAQLNVALADAAIVAWNAKYTYNQWRPITAIRNADLDGNPDTEQDRGWMPLVNTPPFPDYLSGHSTFSGAAERILTDTFGSNFSFTSRAFSLPGDAPGALRSFTSFAHAANEASASRIYGGIHFRESCEVGLAAGRALGDHVLARFSDLSDHTAPVVTVTSPGGNERVRNASFSIEGRVVDGISAVTLAEAQLDDGPWQPLTLTNRPATNGSGDFAYAVSVGGAGGLAQGTHALRLRATDSSGNQSEPLAFSFTIDTAAPVLSVTTPEDGGTLDPADPRLTGTVAGTGSAIAELCYRLNDGPEITMIFDAAGAAAGEGSFDERIRLGDLGPGTHTLTIRARDAAGNETTAVRMFALDVAAPLTVTALSPDEGAGEIGVTQRPRIDFSRPVDPASLTSSNLFLSFSGQVVPTRIVPGADGTFAWLFPTQAMPGASVITMTIRGGDAQNPGIRTSGGELLDGDGDGEAGGTRTLTFTTVSTAPIPGTTVTDAQGNQTIIATTLTGIVADPGPDLSPGGRDDVLVGPDGVLMTLDDVYTRPLVGVEVYILGREHERVFTDVNGRFTLTNVPSGSVKVIVNGLTATGIGAGPNQGPLPAGVYFPEMTMDVICVPGVTNYVMPGMRDAMGHADSARVQGVYLPRIETAILQAVSATEPTVVTIQDAASRNLTPAQRENLMIEVQPGSLVDEQGNPIANGQVGISTVPAELVRDMLPPGILEHTFDITVQAPGAAAFTRPATMTFPNVFNAAPGTKLNFLSFDHTTGRLVIEGTATVSADGTKVVTDAGTGITKPGWHGLTPPGNPLMPPCNPELITVKTIRDFTKALNSCAKAVLGPLGTFIESMTIALDTLATASQNIERLRRDYDNDRDPGRFCVGLLAVEPIFRGAVSVVTDLLGNADPFRKARDAVSCVSDILGLATTLCKNWQKKEECRTVLGQVLCTGLESANVVLRSLNALLNEMAGLRERALLTISRIGFDALKLAVCGPGFDPVPEEEILRLADVVISESSQAVLEGTGTNQYMIEIVSGLDGTQPLEDIAEEVYVSHIVPTYAFYKMDLHRPLWSGSNLLTYGVAVNGQGYPQWVQPNERIEIYAYDPETRRMAHVVIPGGSRSIPPLVFETTSHLPDTDQDGIPDFVETELLRTNPNDPDTDGDGISDEIEAIDGLGPFVDQRSTMGTGAMVELQGEALDVVLYSPGSQIRNVSSGFSTPASPRALVATGSHGVALVGIANPTRPRLLSELSLPGTSSAIAVDELLGLAAVASGNGGLHIVSAGPDGTLSLERSIPVNTTAIAIADGVVYAGVGARLRGYDLLTGEQMLDRALPAPLRQIAVEGSVLYGLASGGTTLTAFSMAVPTVPILSSLSLPQAAAGKLFVGGGTAYIGIGDGAILTGGFISVNIANPQSMQVISGADDLALAGAMVVPNGSGRAVGVGQLVYADTSIVQNRLDVYNTSDLSNTGLLERGILLNARPAAVAISAGLAYVACGPSGLQIVGFLETDINRVRPIVTADPQSVDVDPIRPGIQVVEGSLLAMPVTISDDVQVRETEVLLIYAGNVSTIRTDTTFPFDMRVRLPRIADGSNIATLIYRARDTGGNAGDVFVDVELVEDAVRPTLSGISPEEGATKGPRFRTVSLSFSETIAPETLTSSAIMLRRFDETLIEPIAIQPRFSGRTVVLTYPQLELGFYTVEVDPSLITDLAGNALEGEGVILRSFEVTEFSNIFIGPSGGNWSDPINWSRGVLPDEDDSVLIDLPGNGTVIATNITATIERLTVRDTLVLQNVTINGEVVNRGLIEVRDTSGANRSFLNAGLTNAAGATLLVRGINGISGVANLSIDGA